MWVDWTYLDPLAYMSLGKWRYAFTAVKLVDKRADLLGIKDVLAEAALDPYEFARDAYLQKRLSQVYDGNPPEEDFDFEDEFLDEEDFEDDVPEESG
jgi:phospholipid-binding lipoprotein MlaA